MIFQYTLDKVLSGRKTQTRRVRRPGSQARWKIGHSYAVQPTRTARSVARIVVTGVRHEKLGKITQAGARAEGFPSVAAFARVWTEVHGAFDPQTEVWVVSFRLADSRMRGRKKSLSSSWVGPM